MSGVNAPILKTKFYKPKTRPNLLHRPHLIERLQNGRSGKLTLLTAPAGFGKSTLVTQWLEGDTAVAWFSLDETDNDLLYFWRYMIGALQTIDPKLGVAVDAQLQDLQSPDIKPLIIQLMNEIAESELSLILVLDDFHAISEFSRFILASMDYFLTNLPRNLHLVITSRIQLPFSITKIQAKGQVNEFSITDLRFSLAETTCFLNEQIGLELSQNDILTLHNRVEGWMSALQLAAISLEKHPRVQRSQWITQFSGRNRYLVDFWAEDIVARLPRNLQVFLLRTAVCDRFCAPLADALMAGNLEPISQKPAQELIAMLEKQNLFLIPLDEERNWYRYHPLFADYLRQRVRKQHPQWLTELQTILSAWDGPAANRITNKQTGVNRRETNLTEREQEMLRLIAAGFSNKEIGHQLVVSLNTVRYHSKNLYRKLGVRSRTQAVARAHQMNLI